MGKSSLGFPLGFPRGCSTSPPAAGQQDGSRVKPHVFLLFEVLRHLLGTELQGTSALHETLTGSTTTQHSLLHTWHGHGAERGGTAATALPPRLPVPAASALPRHRDSRICPWALLPWGSGSTGRCRSPEGFWMHCEKPWPLRRPVSRDGGCPELSRPCTGARTPCPRLQALGAPPGLLPGLGGLSQGTSRRHRASTAPLGPCATPPMTKSRPGAEQLEQEQRPVGMGGSGSHLFRERLNPSTESRGHDWFPAREGTASAPPCTPQALPFPAQRLLMPQLNPTNCGWSPSPPQQGICSLSGNYAGAQRD